MAYITTDTNGRSWSRHTIDMVAFAHDLAAELGGTVRRPKASEYPNDRQEIEIGKDLLTVTSDTHHGRVTARISAPDVPWDDRDTYRDSHKTAEATVNPDGRAIKAIAADIKRRVIDASQEALKLQREQAAKAAGERRRLQAMIDGLKVRSPSLRIDPNLKDRRAAIYGGGTSHYISATMYAGGDVSIERIGSVSIEKFEKILAVLNERNG